MSKKKKDNIENNENINIDNENIIREEVKELKEYISKKSKTIKFKLLKPDTIITFFNNKNFKFKSNIVYNIDNEIFEIIKNIGKFEIL